jgi:SAM-dependent methyltransferase
MANPPELETRRLADFQAFLLSRLPPSPARVLEVGCGCGDLARALAGAGYSITAIDPEAPEGAIFRRTRLEDFASTENVDAVVASISLHHVDDLRFALDKIVSLLADRGLLILEEFAKERFAGATARWYYHQRQALAAVGLDDRPVGEDRAEWQRRWAQEHADIHSYASMRRELDRRFTTRFFSWTPYLYSYWLDDALEPLERKLIETRAVEATGFRYVGERLAS